MLLSLLGDGKYQRLSWWKSPVYSEHLGWCGPRLLFPLLLCVHFSALPTSVFRLQCVSAQLLASLAPASCLLPPVSPSSCLSGGLPYCVDWLVSSLGHLCLSLFS